MLNLRKTIIFCVLFAAIWMQSTNAMEPVDYLTEALERVYHNRTLLPRGCVDHFKSWESWGNVTDGDKHRIAMKYMELVEKDQLQLWSGRNDKSRAKLSQWACKALDEDVKVWYQILQQSVQDWMEPKMRQVVSEGKFLEALGYRGGPYYYLTRGR